MNIIITDTFKKDFLSIFKSELLIKWFCDRINSTKLLKLKHPFDKIKFKYVWIDIRWLLFIWIADKLFPIFIIKKSNKKYWNNLVLNYEITKIAEWKLEKVLLDFKNDDFKIY